MTRQLDLVAEAEVVVVGGGPAGAAAATALADLGHEVLILDQHRFPRDKACGDGLTKGAVAALRQLGLGELVERGRPIEGTRLVVDYSTPERKPPRTRRQPASHACALPRLTLDAGLLGRATGAGAGLIQCRVEAPISSDGAVVGLEVVQDEVRGAVRAPHVIAADGATSRLRRALAPSREPFSTRSYAVRRYFRTGESLEPFFDFFVPVECGGQLVAGYGWVFPIDERTANVGVGYYQGAGLASPPPIRDVLDAFVETLGRKWEHRLGALEATGRPVGSPVAINFSAERCQVGNVLFAGDAARMCNPLSGEGIAQALGAGEDAARALHATIRRTGRPRYGASLRHRFPALGQDISLAARLYVQGMGRRDRELRQARFFSAPDEPMLDELKSMLSLSATAIRVEETPVWRLMARKDPACAEDLETVSRGALETVGTDFPLVSEVLHRRLHGAAGPVVAATALLAASSAGQRSGEAVQAALGSELLGLFPSLLGLVMQRAERSRAKLNNAFAILMGDYAVSRALRIVTGFGPEPAAWLAQTGGHLSEAQALELEDAFDTGRPLERYRAAAETGSGRLFGFAAKLGARIGGADPVTATRLERYGRSLGPAFRIAEDVLRLVADDAMTGRRAGADLRTGTYTLPTIYAIEDKPELGHLLGPELGETQIARAHELIRETAAIERATVECERYAREARAAVQDAPRLRTDALVALAALPVDELRGWSGRAASSAA